MMSGALLAVFLLAPQARAQDRVLTAPATSPSGSGKTAPSGDGASQGAPAQAPAEEAPEFDPSQYPLMTLAKAAAAAPCGGGKVKYELRDRLFSAELVFQGSVRRAPPAQYELIKRWTKSIGDPEAAERYKKQISFSEGKKIVWMCLPEGLIDYLKEDFQVGDRALVYGVFVGCAGGKPVFSLDEYDTYAPADEEAEDYITRAPEARWRAG